MILLLLDSIPGPKKDFEGLEAFGWVERHGTMFRGTGFKVRETLIQITLNVSLTHLGLCFCVTKMG